MQGLANGWRSPMGLWTGGEASGATMTEAITERVKLGIPGLSVPQGSHLCGFFRGRKERDADPEISAALADEQLNVVLSSDVYFGRGEFSVAGMLDYWDAVLENLYFVPPGQWAGTHR